MPRVGLQTSASNPTWQIANGLSAWRRATRSRKCTSVCARTTPFSVGSYLWGRVNQRAEGRGGNGTVLHLIIMVSSISSTPECNLFVKTGGTARTIDALTERNSSFAFSLRALFGEISTSMGTGELLRFIFLFDGGTRRCCALCASARGRKVRCPSSVLAAPAQALGIPSVFPAPSSILRRVTRVTPHGIYRISYFLAHI